MISDRLTTSALEEALHGLPVGEIHYFDRIGSTNDFAFERAEAGAPDLSVAAAFEQTEGRGRMQRRWITVPGTSLPMSIIIRPQPSEMGYLNLFSPLTGLAVREALLDGYGIESRIKWPNDVLLNRRKICGILCETRWESDRLQALILGLGTNLRRGSAPEISDIVYPASSIEEESGIIIPPADWIRCFLEQLIRLRPLLGTPAFFELWENCLAYRGETAKLVRPDGTCRICTVLGIDPEGKLRVKNESGREECFLAGEISLRPAR